MSAPADVLTGPTAADLDAIEAEWPLIEAELAALDAEIRALSAAGGPSPLERRRVRRSQRRVLAGLRESCHPAQRQPPPGAGRVCAPAGGPELVQVRLSGDARACDALTAVLAAYPGVRIIAQSGPRANHRDPGHRLYLTVHLTLPEGDVA
jgi:hypothetical protein